MSTASEEKLSKEQVEIFSLLSIASFLEYFDLMFYVHMRVLCNDVFFPTATKPLLASFVTAFSWSLVTSWSTTYMRKERNLQFCPV